MSVKWNYDFNTPITANITTANWFANTNTSYRVEDCIENLKKRDSILFKAKRRILTAQHTLLQIPNKSHLHTSHLMCSLAH